GATGTWTAARSRRPCPAIAPRWRRQARAAAVPAATARGAGREARKPAASRCGSRLGGRKAEPATEEEGAQDAEDHRRKRQCERQEPAVPGEEPRRQIARERHCQDGEPHHAPPAAEHEEGGDAGPERRRERCAAPRR